ncbi:Oidioi.mRNA.OKI2018_I69.PAR.g13217.t1.cds [Oikopleura dioica]|uniref:Oidioi.mRNA.OKI2018_I69.PAR.g13217.t1.cds n=1 Tax=Oikopleura dioica TaxID=34765 RepID=A0ABN7S8E2_OIKDI|nr:Oidioi.mRNA.OKI2018_I69.PAR.g13217.t1.cds [Oikopleura dioica]
MDTVESAPTGENEVRDPEGSATPNVVQETPVENHADLGAPQNDETQDGSDNTTQDKPLYNDELGLCECPEGQVVIDGSCDSPCPEGSEMEAGSCVSKCPEEQIYKDEECYCADGSLASLTKPCCELGQHWSAEKSLCVCDGGDSCNQVCPDSLPNQFLDVFGKLHCCASDQVFNVREQKCMCMGSFGSKKFADPVDGKCSCPGMKQVITDGAFTCEPSICSPSQIFSPITALCECPADKYPFENDMSGEIECCPAGQKWSNILLMCICIEGNMLPNANGVCEEVEECPPGWYFSGKTHEYGQILTECLPACPDPAMVWFVDSETAANVTSVSCKCKGEFKYTLSTDVPMTNYVTDGWCEPEECPVGMIRSEDVSNFNECVCPYHWQTITDNGGCSCDHPHYSMFFNTCTCKEKVFAYQVFGADGTCQCPIGMAYDPETFGCREDCYFFGEDPSTGEDKCMTKEEFEAAYTANPTPNPLTQIDDTCPGFEVGWKGIKSSRVTLRSSNDNVNSYQILTNVRDNQNNVDVTKDDYIGFLVWSKRHCGYAFIEEIIQGGVTISMWDQSDIYKLQQAYLSQDKSQTQTVLQFKVQHNRDAQGNIIGGNLMVDGKKDQFYLNINVDSSIEFAYGEEYCLTSFNVGVMKSAMNFGENYTYCVPNGGSYWWSKPSNPSLTRDSNQSD